jgi:hypothetical protein
MEVRKHRAGKDHIFQEFATNLEQCFTAPR